MLPVRSPTKTLPPFAPRATTGATKPTSAGVYFPPDSGIDTTSGPLPVPLKSATNSRPPCAASPIGEECAGKTANGLSYPLQVAGPAGQLGEPKSAPHVASLHPATRR